MSRCQNEARVDDTPETVRKAQELAWCATSAPAACLPVGRLASWRRGNCPRALGWVGLALALAGPRVHAQEALRQSMAGAQAAEDRKKAASTLGYYNVKMGPLGANFEADTAVVFSDNINYSPNNTEADVIVRPQIASHMRWRVSELNSLSLTLGAGYSAYARHSDLDRFYLVPGSETSFDIYSGDFWINLHDRFSITDNAFQDPSFAGTGDYQVLNNTAGVSVTWDLGRVNVKSGFDVDIWESLTGSSLTVNGSQSELLSLAGSYAVIPSVRVGLESSGDWVSYTWHTNASSGAIQSQGTQWSAGPFSEVQLSQRLSLRAGAGYTVFEPGSGPSLGARLEGPYAHLTLRHRPNNYLEYWVSAGRSLTFNSYAGPLEYYNAALGANWQLLRKLALLTSFYYQRGTETEVGYGIAHYEWLGIRFDVSRPITRKLSAQLGYRLYQRLSDRPNNGYTVNVASLNLKYQF